MSTDSPGATGVRAGEEARCSVSWRCLGCASRSLGAAPGALDPGLCLRKPEPGAAALWVEPDRPPEAGHRAGAPSQHPQRACRPRADPPSGPAFRDDLCDPEPCSPEPQAAGGGPRALFSAPPPAAVVVALSEHPHVASGPQPPAPPSASGDINLLLPQPDSGEDRRLDCSQHLTVNPGRFLVSGLLPQSQDAGCGGPQG